MAVTLEVYNVETFEVVETKTVSIFDYHWEAEELERKWNKYAVRDKYGELWPT